MIHSDTATFLMPFRYKLTDKGKLSQEELPTEDVRSLLMLLNSLLLN